MEVLNEEGKPYAEFAEICDNKSLCEIMKKEKEIYVRFAVASKTAKSTATAPGKCLVTMEKALNLWWKT